MFNNQEKFDIRCEWGLNGVKNLSKISEATIIIDILSFSTCVDIAVSKGAKIYPYQYSDLSKISEYANKFNAIIANKRSKTSYSLSPNSLIEIKDGTRLILPSPNGSTLTLNSESKYTITCCLRNYKAVAEFIKKNNLKKIAIIPAGEKWNDNTLRPCVEDLLGAGALISELKGNFSPESLVAKSVFESNKNNLESLIFESISSLELIERDYIDDIELALEINKSNNVPILYDNYYSL